MNLSHFLELTSCIAKWWPKLAPIFAEVLLDPKISTIVKSSVVLSLGKVSHYMEESSEHFIGIKNILLELSGYENNHVSEIACYSLANVALVHQSLVCFEDLFWLRPF